MKYLIYARVSPRGSDFEGETTIQMQIDFCREYVKFHGGEIIGEYHDEFFSGKDTHRPAFKKIMDQLESGNAEWDTLIVYKLSRMTRSLRDGANIFAALFAQAKGFISATENLDFSSPAGRAMLGMMQVFNQFEREQGAENVSNKMNAIARQGLWPVGRVPYGYKRGDKKDNKLYVDDKKAEIVRDVFEMYVSDKYTTHAILSKYKKTLVKSQILRILRDPTYLGKICYGGEIFPGKHDAIISKDLFEHAQRKLPQKKTATRPKAQKWPFLLAGMLFCHCGCRLSPRTAKSGQFAYYSCTDIVDCKTCVSAPVVEKAVIDVIKKLDISEKFIATTIKSIEHMQKEQIEKSAPELSRLKSALRQSMAEKEKVFKILCEDGLNKEIKNYANEKITSLSSEIETFSDKIKIIESVNCNDVDLYTIAIQMARDLQTFSSNLICIEDCDKDSLRRIILSNIDKIQADGKGNYQIYPAYGDSSTKGSKWWA